LRSGQLEALRASLGERAFRAALRRGAAHYQRAGQFMAWPYIGVPAMLSALSKAGIGVVLVSRTPRATLERIIDRWGLELHAAHFDCPTLPAPAQDRRERLADSHGAVEVGLEDRVRLVDRARLEEADEVCDTGVIDQQVHVARGIGGCRNFLGFCDVEPERRDASRKDTVAAARRAVHLVRPAPDELDGDRATETSIGACHERGGIADLHDALPFS